jgi:hypothetical protein
MLNTLFPCLVITFYEFGSETMSSIYVNPFLSIKLAKRKLFRNSDFHLSGQGSIHLELVRSHCIALGATGSVVGSGTLE